MTMTSRLGPGELDAEAARDLVAHAGKAVFEVVAAGALPPATACAVRPAGRRRRRRRPCRARRCAGPRRSPARRRAARRWSARSPRAAACRQSARCVVSSPRCQSAGASSRRAPTDSSSRPTRASQTSGSARCLAASKGWMLRPTMRRSGIVEQRPRAGGEILQPRADGEDDVGLLGQRVGGRGAGDADRADGERVAGGNRGLAGLGLGDRARRGSRQSLTASSHRLAVEHAAAGNDERLLCRAQRLDRGGKLALVGTDAARQPQALGEEALGIVESLGLDVLAEGERHRPAIGRIGQHRHGALQRRDELLGPGDAVEIARHRPEAVVGRDGAVAEILDLLQDRDRECGVAKTSPGTNSTGRRLTWATAAAVTMLVAPGPMEDVHAIMRRRRLALAKAMAACAMACSLLPR